MKNYLFNSKAASYLGVLILLLLLPQFIPGYHITLVQTGLSMGILALGINLLLRYTGVLSFGHGAYFASGAYAVGLLNMYFPEYFSFEMALLSAILVSALVSAIFGLVCVRHSKVFFSILTLALSMLLFAILEKAYHFTGGSDGIRIPMPSFFGFEFEMRKYPFLIGPYYYIVVGVFSAATVVMLAIVNSPFGKALQATRDNEVRAEMIGIRVKRYRWYAFVISGVFSGLAGAVWSFSAGHITPEVSNWVFSGEIVYMVLLGGFMIFEGPIVGAMLFTYLNLYAKAATEYWMLIMGVTLVTLVLVLPGGITGGISSLFSALKPKRA